MVIHNNLLAVAAFVLMAASLSAGQSRAEKLAECCKKVTNEKIQEPILDFMLQERNLPCVKAVIFQTKSGLYCVNGKASWVRQAIRELTKAKPLSTTPSVVSTSPVSLLTKITSMASSSSTPLSSSTSPDTSSPSSTYEMSSGEMFSGNYE
ncbi:uncharacterized protein KZ484_018751 [Pholidichthys leucotaenia]